MQMNRAGDPSLRPAFGSKAATKNPEVSSPWTQQPPQPDLFERKKAHTQQPVTFSGRSDLHDAATLGNVSELHELMQGADADYLNEQDEDGNTALHMAAAEGKLNAVRVLLGKKGIDPSITNRENETALDLALIQGRTQVATLLASRMGVRHCVSLHSGGYFNQNG